MTYKKKLIEITITTVDGNTVTVTDTAEDQKASLALAEIKSGRFVKVENALIATSAIVKVEVTQLEDAEVERANPYGCGGGSEPVVNTIHLVPMEFTVEGETTTSVACTDCCNAWNEIVAAASTEGVVPIAHGEGHIAGGGESVQIDGQLFNFVSSDDPWRFPYINGSGKSIAVLDLSGETPDYPCALVVPALEGELTITYEIVEGYKITTQYENPQLHQMVVATHYVKAGEPFEFALPVIGDGSCATDGTNTYHYGDTITPTSDMTFTLVECE